MLPVIAGKARSFEVRSEVSHAFNEDLQRRIGETTWVSCQSYYRMGTEHTGKVFATFPGPVVRFWYLTRRVQWADYSAVGAQKWEKERKLKRIAMLVVWTISLASAGTVVWCSRTGFASIAPITRRLVS
jgi:hypothetical protein